LLVAGSRSQIRNPLCHNKHANIYFAKLTRPSAFQCTFDSFIVSYRIEDWLVSYGSRHVHVISENILYIVFNRIYVYEIYRICVTDSDI